MDSKDDFAESFKELKAAYNSLLEKSKKNIDGIDIYIIDSKKYRKRKDGSFDLACDFNNCNKYAFSKNGGIYCNGHRNGLDPSSDEKKKEREIRIENAKVLSKDAFKTGDSTEEWVVDQLKLIDSVVDAKRIGYDGSKYDIEFKLAKDVDSRGIQVKTLIKNKRAADAYQFEILNETYSKNTLFVGVSKDRTRFVVMFYENFKNMRPTFTYSCSESIYQRYMFKDYNKFIERLRAMLLKTDICDKNCRPPTREQEYNSLLRLSSKCIQNQLPFKNTEESDSVIDCVVNDYNIQHKTSKTKERNSYSFNLAKGNGKQPNQPYSDKDNIDFFILEIIDFNDNFYIIPINALVKSGHIRTDKYKGKTKLCVPNPKTGDKLHWLNKYLNRFDLLN